MFTGRTIVRHCTTDDQLPPNAQLLVDHGRVRLCVVIVMEECVIAPNRLSSHYSSTPILTEEGVNPDIWSPWWEKRQQQGKSFLKKVKKNFGKRYYGSLKGTQHIDQLPIIAKHFSMLNKSVLFHRLIFPTDSFWWCARQPFDPELIENLLHTDSIKNLSKILQIIQLLVELLVFF